MIRAMDVITTHVNADFDAVGSMIAAKKIYPDAQVVFSGGEEKSIRDFFIQSSLYSLDMKTLKDIRLEDVSRLILVDTRQRDRIGKFASIVDNPKIEIHVYDHHPENDDDIQGNLEIIERTGACVSIMTKILIERSIKITPAEATILQLGIYEDTGSLTFASTSRADFEAAAYLLDMGANLSTVADIMAHTLTAGQIFVLADLIRNARDFNVMGQRVTVTEASINEYTEELAVAVNRMRETEGLDVVIALIRDEDRIYLIARSQTDAIDVSRIAKHFGGGGHPYAASATIRKMTLVQAREVLQASLHSVLRKPRTAISIMTYPVKTTKYGDTIEEVNVLFNRYNINVLPIMNSGKIAGYITRTVVGKARHHGLQNSPVEEFMTVDIITAHPDTPFNELYEMVVGRKQRVVPVLNDKEELVGVVTRTDILNHVLDERTMGTLHSKNQYRNEERPTHFRDLKGLLKDRLPKYLIEVSRTIGEVAQQLDMTAYLVGGFVRDLILRRENLDLDIVIEGDAIELARVAAEKLNARMSPHAEFKTAVMVLPDETKIDFATARLEYYEHPAALPVVEASSIKLDLYRRDFTINTLVICVNPERYGEMVDFFGAYKDIKDKQIRVLHNLSFIEDPTRVLRALRFELRFDFEIGKHTYKLLKSAVRTEFLKKVDGHRMFSELKLILQEEDPLSILKRMRDVGAMEAFHPRLRLSRRQLLLLEQIEDVLSWYDLLFLEKKVERWKVWLLGLIGHLRQKDVIGFLQRLDLSEKEVTLIAQERRIAEEVIHGLNKLEKLSNSLGYRICSKADTESLLLVMSKSAVPDIRKFVSLYLTTLQGVKTKINGQDLLEMGYSPGPVFSQIFEKLLDARLDNIVLNRDQELAFVAENFPLPEKKKTVGK